MGLDKSLAWILVCSWLLAASGCGDDGDRAAGDAGSGDGGNTCEPFAQARCDEASGDLYYFDSCGERGEIASECSESEICRGEQAACCLQPDPTGSTPSGPTASVELDFPSPGNEISLSLVVPEQPTTGVGHELRVRGLTELGRFWAIGVSVGPNPSIYLIKGNTTDPQYGEAPGDSVLSVAGDSLLIQRTLDFAAGDRLDIELTQEEFFGTGTGTWYGLYLTINDGAKTQIARGSWQNSANNEVMLLSSSVTVEIGTFPPLAEDFEDATVRLSELRLSDSPAQSSALSYPAPWGSEVTHRSGALTFRQGRTVERCTAEGSLF